MEQINNAKIYEYIWLDSDNEFRSKTRIIYSNNYIELYNLPIWNYDGSSTGQALGSDSEIFLKPVAIFKDPFRKNMSAYLIWCSCYDKNKIPLSNGHRNLAVDIFNKYKEQEPWFGIEQEYFIIEPKTNLPLGFKNGAIPEPQGKYYCGVGANRVFFREIPETHMEHCLYAGIKICGINAEVAPYQWEYQIGPSEGIEAGDHLWISRYILNRVAELVGLSISYHPKPLGSNTDWNGSGCHTNFSTKLMREPDGIQYINKAIYNLSLKHKIHMDFYGEHNRERMSGLHETSSYDVFTFGRANRGASVRIPNSVLEESKGYFEDRRPAANCDPYLVTYLIMKTTSEQITTSDKITLNEQIITSEQITTSDKITLNEQIITSK